MKRHTEEFKFNKDTDIREYRRLIMLRLTEKGMGPTEIADIVGCSKGLVSQVLAAYESDGFDGIISGTHSGKQSQLNKSDKQKLKDYLKKGAKTFGYQTDS